MAKPTSSPRTAPSAALPSAMVASIRRKLLAWYDGHRRDLPWRRRAGDAYAQWVAEVMLQQTRVETVIDYYRRFLRRFPTVGVLAAADHDHVLKQWEGLGYYRRVLHLHRAAQQVVAEGGVIPDTAEGLRRLPGVGAYTAAAIASIAFGRREAAVDGNVARVVARLFAVEENILSPRGKGVIQGLADQLVPPRRPGDFNQAWMDLGSAVCTPKAPKCLLCPLVEACVAAATGRAESLPLREKRAPVPHVVCVVAVVIRNGAVLVRQRPTGGLWSGLWELPNAELTAGRHRAAALRVLCTSYELSAGGKPRRIGQVEHRLTHRALTFEVYALKTNGKRESSESGRHRWATRAALEDLSFSTAHRKILALVEERL